MEACSAKLAATEQDGSLTAAPLSAASKSPLTSHSQQKDDNVHERFAHSSDARSVEVAGTSAATVANQEGAVVQDLRSLFSTLKGELVSVTLFSTVFYENLIRYQQVVASKMFTWCLSSSCSWWW